MSTREDILDDELMRQTPGLRPFSVGVFKLCRKLGLSLATPNAPKQSPEDSGREMLIISWMLDEKHPLSEVRALPEMPKEKLVAMIDEYEFELAPAFLARVSAEIARTKVAVEKAAFAVEEKPGSSQGSSPSGKS